MFYLVKSPKIFQWYYHECLWKVATDEKVLYLTFDDGPTPEVTDFVLDQLRQYDAQATFFNVGEQAERFPELQQRLIDDGHTVGNHTYNHLNGWKTDNEVYLDNIEKAMKVIDSPYFRPPYGRITKFQLYNIVQGNRFRLRPIMWHILSGDFDPKISAEQCYLNVLRKAEKGSIIVFHDSRKSFSILKGTLPKVLAHFSKQGYRFDSIDAYYKNIGE